MKFIDISQPTTTELHYNCYNKHTLSSLPMNEILANTFIFILNRPAYCLLIVFRNSTQSQVTRP